MKLEIVNPHTFDETAAQLAITQIAAKPNSTIGFATGNTTVGLHHVLADTINNQKICIDKIAVYNLDEYLGLSQENPLSCFYRMKDQLYNPIGLSPNQINFL